MSYIVRAVRNIGQTWHRIPHGLRQWTLSVKNSSMGGWRTISGVVRGDTIHMRSIPRVRLTKVSIPLGSANGTRLVLGDSRTGRIHWCATVSFCISHQICIQSPPGILGELNCMADPSGTDWPRQHYPFFIHRVTVKSDQWVSLVNIWKWDRFLPFLCDEVIFCCWGYYGNSWSNLNLRAFKCCLQPQSIIVDRNLRRGTFNIRKGGTVYISVVRILGRLLFCGLFFLFLIGEMLVLHHSSAVRRDFF